MMLNIKANLRTSSLIFRNDWTPNGYLLCCTMTDAFCRFLQR